MARVYTFTEDTSFNLPEPITGVILVVAGGGSAGVIGGGGGGGTFYSSSYMFGAGDYFVKVGKSDEVSYIKYETTQLFTVPAGGRGANWGSPGSNGGSGGGGYGVPNSAGKAIYSFGYDGSDAGGGGGAGTAATPTSGGKGIPYAIDVSEYYGGGGGNIPAGISPGDNSTYGRGGTVGLDSGVGTNGVVIFRYNGPEFLFK